MFGKLIDEIIDALSPESVNVLIDLMNANDVSVERVETLKMDLSSYIAGDYTLQSRELAEIISRGVPIR